MDQTQNFTDCWIMIMTYEWSAPTARRAYLRFNKKFHGLAKFILVYFCSCWRGESVTRCSKNTISPPVRIRATVSIFFYRLHSLSPVTLSSACRRSYRFTGLFFRSFWLSKKLQCDWMSGNLFYFVILVIRGALKSTKPRVFLRILTQRFFCSVTGWVAKYFTICQVNGLR